ncbi:Protein LITTLE ZIPPER like [Melia azedarach]|uniref:Protein LITTLE ZIPPER like n=1 Tax=Melia azedarach TaxID=155640 RepID=A0ACC1YTP1_MELAZ|nr:Protein LITTLE ZIPPER like [Melia azedarach]
MCMNSADLFPCSTFHLALRHRRRSERQSLRVRRLNRRRRSSKEGKGKEKEYLRAKMELKNLRLYRENQIIIKENEKLRKRAHLLRQENQDLLSQLQKKFPHNH